MTTEEAIEEVSEESPEAATEQADEKELTFEEKLEAATKMVSQNPSYRRVFYDLLDACAEGVRPLGELEALVEAHPGYEKLRQPAYFPISWLQKSYALEIRYLDADGREYTYEDIEGFTEDEFDDLIEQYAFVTTDVGSAVREQFDPKNQLQILIDEVPERAALYTDILNFAKEKRAFAEIDKLIRGREELTTTALDGVTVSPNALVSKLESVGGLFYDGGWQITDEGRAFLGSYGE